MAKKYSLPQANVTFINDEGEEKTLLVQTDGRDNFAFSMIRRSTKDIPTMKDDPLLWTYIMFWSALKRMGETSARWDAFCSSQLIDISQVEEEEEPESDPLAIL